VCGSEDDVNTDDEPNTAARDCYEILQQNGDAKDGVYTIHVGHLYRSEKTPVKVYCDMTTEGGGWTVVSTLYIINRNNT